MASNSYFSHDSNARNSKKMLRMRARLGDKAAAAYGVYWMLVERLREEESYVCEKDYDMLAFDLRVDPELIRTVVEDFGLFDISDDGRTFSSHGLHERMEEAAEKHAAKSAAGKKGAESKWGDSSVRETRSRRLTLAREKGSHTKAQWDEMKDFFGHCVICGKAEGEVKICKDHIVPLYQGGSDAITNIQPLCTSCNCAKGPDNHDYRVDWCERNGVEMPGKWLAQSDETPDYKRKENKENKENYSFSLSPSPSGEGAEEEKEKIVSFFTFQKNWASPCGEYEKLVAYNNRPEARKKWSQMSKREKESAVALWKQKDAKARFAPPVLEMWKKLYQILLDSGAPAQVRMAALDDGVSIGCDGGQLVLALPDALRGWIERDLDEFKPVIWPMVERMGCGSLKYKLIKPTNTQQLQL